MTMWLRVPIAVVFLVAGFLAGSAYGAGGPAGAAVGLVGMVAAALVTHRLTASREVDARQLDISMKPIWRSSMSSLTRSKHRRQERAGCVRVVWPRYWTSRRK